MIVYVNLRSYGGNKDIHTLLLHVQVFLIALAPSGWTIIRNASVSFCFLNFFSFAFNDTDGPDEPRCLLSLESVNIFSEQ